MQSDKLPPVILLSCIVGNLGFPVCYKHCSPVTMLELIMDSLKTNAQNRSSKTRDIDFFGFHVLLLLFKTCCVHYPQCNLATDLLSE